MSVSRRIAEDLMRVVHRFLCIVLLLFVGWPGYAAAQAGSDLTSFPVLTLEASARAAALSGASGAMIGEDVNALFYNPALLETDQPAASLSYTNHLSDINAGALAYARTLDRWGTTVGAGLRFVHWGEFDGRDAQGAPTGTFRAGDVALTLTASQAGESRSRYGVSVHVVHSALEAARATAIAADLGTQYRIPTYGLTLAASLRHLGTTLDAFGPGDTVLPADLRLSLSKDLAHLPLRLIMSGYDLNHLGTGVADGSALDNVMAHVLLGGELTLSGALHLRAGYNHRRSTELALSDRLDLAGLNLGFGLVLSRLNVDYAYSSWSSLGGLHQFTLRTSL